MVYEPREDSFLLQEQVEKLAKGSVLDVGTGTGIQAEAAANKKSVKKILAVDIDKEAINFCRATIKHRKIKFIVGDLFANIKNKQKFDTIVFNPPYLPEEPKLKDLVGFEKGELALSGGKKGHELLERFLKQAGSFLKPDGIILLVFSSLTNKSKVDSLIENNLLDFRELATEHIFFEELFVYLIKKKQLLTELEKKGVRAVHYFSRGKRGVVYVGEFRGKKVAIKTKKKESEAIGRMKNEALMLKLLNKYKLGPKLLFAGKNYVAYEFVEGEYVAKWLLAARKKEAALVLKSALQQCFKLDQLRISKDEMHHPFKHIIIGKKGKSAAFKVTFIDFERAHKMKKPHNVTQFCQYVLSVRRMLAKKGTKVDKSKMIEAARRYQTLPVSSNLEKILALVE
jgi:HemK-related putative methylase